MQKAMFLSESYKKGILAEVDAGYILTLNVPDDTDIEHKLDPYRLEIISYSGVKSIQPVEGGLRFSSAGSKILCLIEPTNYPKRHIEPAFRSTKATEHMPFRLKECDVLLTDDDKYRVLLPTKPVDCVDSFTVEFPRKGDMCVLYFIFSENINEIVLPYIAENLQKILKSVVALRTVEAMRVAGDFIFNVKKFQVEVRASTPGSPTSGSSA